MMYNIKDFNENKIEVKAEDRWGAAYDYRGHRIAWETNFSNIDKHTYYAVYVDGEVVATRTKRSECERKAMKYLNEMK